MSSKTIVIFGSSQPKPGDEEYNYAYTLGKALGEASFAVSNGGYRGTMEASAKGAYDASSQTVGVLVETLKYQKPNDYIKTTIVSPNILKRIEEMMNIGDAYIILKGGTGTLLELAAVWEFVNKNFFEEKPIIVNSFWGPVVDLLTEEKSLGEFYTKNGKIKPCTNYITKMDDISEIVAFLKKRLA